MPSGSEWIIVLVIVLLVFGGSQLPKLAKNLGKAQKEFKDGLAEGHEGRRDQRQELINRSTVSACTDGAEPEPPRRHAARHEPSLHDMTGVAAGLA